MKEHTIIFVPHARARFRKWKFSTAEFRVVFLIIFGSVGYTLCSVPFMLYAGVDNSVQSEEVVAEDVEVAKSRSALLQGRLKANEAAVTELIATDKGNFWFLNGAQVASLLRDLDRDIGDGQQLLGEISQQVLAAQEEFEKLERIRGSGEDTAKAYRELLKTRSMPEKVRDIVISFMIGVLATLFAEAITR